MHEGCLDLEQEGCLDQHEESTVHGYYKKGVWTNKRRVQCVGIPRRVYGPIGGVYSAWVLQEGCMDQ